MEQQEQQEQQDEQKVYKFNGKEYSLSDEVVKGGCQGCAFYDKLDCATRGRTDICNKEHKIFKRIYKHMSNG